MNKKLYVGNLSYGTTEEELHKLFAQVGAVSSVTLITDRQTGQSKGFGFVEMETAEDAQKAIEQYHQATLNERTLTVNEARPREEASGGGGRSGDRRGNRGNFSRSGSDRRRY